MEQITVQPTTLNYGIICVVQQSTRAKTNHTTCLRMIINVSFAKSLCEWFEDENGNRKNDFQSKVKKKRTAINEE